MGDPLIVSVCDSSEMPGLDLLIQEFVTGTDTGFAAMKACPESIRTTIDKKQDGTCFFVVHVGDVLVGGIGAALYMCPQMLGKVIAQEWFYWVRKDYRGSGAGKILEMVYAEWAKEHGAKAVLMSSPDEKIGSIYEGMGYQKIETWYLKEV